MKKQYSKPGFIRESMEMSAPIVRTCADAADYWFEIDTGIDGIVLFVPKEMAGCTMTDDDYMKEHGGNDGSCLFATTGDGITFNS